MAGQKERMLAGELYLAAGPGIAADAQRAADVARITTGENAVVGAGAVVTKDQPPNVVAVGNPTRVIRHI